MVRTVFGPSVAISVVVKAKSLTTSARAVIDPSRKATGASRLVQLLMTPPSVLRSDHDILTCLAAGAASAAGLPCPARSRRVQFLRRGEFVGARLAVAPLSRSRLHD